MSVVQSNTQFEATGGFVDSSQQSEGISFRSVSSGDLSNVPRGEQISPRSPTAKKGPSPEIRARIRDRWRAACAAAEGFARSAMGDHSDCLFRVGQLKRHLVELWGLREFRDENWVGILDRVQVALDQLDDRVVETIEAGKAKIIRDLVFDFLSPSTKSEAELQGSVQLVSELDIPPFVDLAALAKLEL